jgi:transcriptional regulator with XRE-family HTH domain
MPCAVFSWKKGVVMGRGKTKGGSGRTDILIGRRIRLAREQAGISQVQVAAAIGVTYQQLQKYEGGKNRISASMLLQLSVFFGVPVEWFLQGARDVVGTRTAPEKPTLKMNSLAEEKKIYRTGELVCGIESPKLKSCIIQIAKEINRLEKTVRAG